MAIIPSSGAAPAADRSGNLSMQLKVAATGGATFARQKKQFTGYYRLKTTGVQEINNMWVVAVFFFLFALFDVHYFFWAIVIVLKSKLYRLLRGKDVDLLSTVTTRGLCTSTDLDFMCHMNNARYLRNADFNRFDFWQRTGAWDITKELGGSVTLGSSTIRYRKSIQLFDLYDIHARILCWDEKAFYMEQKYTRVRDGFICSIAIVKQVFINVTPAEVVTKVTGRETPSPEFPPEVKAWIESNAISSQKLRKDL